MKIFQTIAISTLIISGCSAFAPSRTTHHAVTSSSATKMNTQLHAGYVPDGLTPEQYRKIRTAEKKKYANKNLGQLGPRGFKSRSMQAWQEAYEKGETGHSFAPFGYRRMLQEGKLRKQDVPYMVRGGSWDNSDVRGARRRKWLQTDRDYAKGGYKKEQSVSILGSGPGFNWTGEKREVDTAPKRALPGLS